MDQKEIPKQLLCSHTYRETPENLLVGEQATTHTTARQSEDKNKFKTVATPRPLRRDISNAATQVYNVQLIDQAN